MIDVLEKAARRAGRVLVTYFEKGVSVSHKTSFKDLLTEADIKSQRIIYDTLLTESIKKGYQKEEIGFIGEEKLNVAGKYKFIIDPLDGTTNFASGIDYFAISIAFAKGEEILSGVVYDPLKDKLFYAEKGQGSFLLYKKRRLRLRHLKKPIRECMFIFTLSLKKETFSKQFEVSKKIYSEILGVRSFHATALDLALCSKNTFQIAAHARACIWDIAAAGLIFEESGGVLVDWPGRPITYDLRNPEKMYQFVACHPKLLPDVLPFFSD